MRCKEFYEDAYSFDLSDDDAKILQQNVLFYLKTLAG